MDADILEKLTHIEDVLRDIRDGRAEPPRGAGNATIATPDDIYHNLNSIIGLLERQNILIYNLGVALCDVNDAVPEYWKNLNR
ncbi:hypothetical protein [Mycolicibacterium fortuitum]|jgi:hypothetical protein|uniref:hypothetical protein n=1 Tax=Mycolicibacterium fortuitum TaxID=1766 RepID=UPI0007EB229E|nr:hypothetical protein [Mycolicibacterium fortuitum]OBG43002.1 hypothetical protein A5670_01205 [Mycolicibacterium fortuitum]